MVPKWTGALTNHVDFLYSVRPRAAGGRSVHCETQPHAPTTYVSSLSESENVRLSPQPHAHARTRADPSTCPAQCHLLLRLAPPHAASTSQFHTRDKLLALRQDGNCRKRGARPWSAVFSVFSVFSHELAHNCNNKFVVFIFSPSCCFPRAYYYMPRHARDASLAWKLLDNSPPSTPHFPSKQHALFRDPRNLILC